MHSKLMKLNHDLTSSYIFLNKMRTLQLKNIQRLTQIFIQSLPFYSLTVMTVLFHYLIINSNSWLCIMFILCIVPLLDEVLPFYEPKLTDSDPFLKQMRSFFYQMTLVAGIISNWWFFSQTLSYISNLEFSFKAILNYPAMLTAFIIIQTLQMIIYHQLFHKPGKLIKIAASLLATKNFYMHFLYEHTYSHHKKVGLPEDPSYVQKGISIYQFAPRSFLRCLQCVYQMEKQKQWWQNLAVISLVGSLVSSYLVWLFFGCQATIFYLILEGVGIIVIESGSYYSHYGLKRKQLPQGGYQKADNQLSWNHTFSLSKFIMFKSSYHSAHHSEPTKQFQNLQCEDNCPKLPHGFFLMIHIAFSHQDWFAIVDPLVTHYNENHNTPIPKQLMKEARQKIIKFLNVHIIAIGLITSIVSLV